MFETFQNLSVIDTFRFLFTVVGVFIEGYFFSEIFFSEGTPT